MDKDSVILKHDQLEVDDAQADIEELKESNDSQEERLSQMQKKLEELGATPSVSKKPKLQLLRKKESPPQETLVEDYESLYEKAYDSLKQRGIDPDSLDYAGLVSQEELDEIIKDLNAPLPREEKWNKSDFIAVFIASIIASISELVTYNKVIKNDSFNEALNKLHEKTFKHKGNSPIDFQGKIEVPELDQAVSFGGGDHRVRSRGHDLLRFISGIKQFKEGKFVAVAHKNKKKILLESAKNIKGNDYMQLSSIEALIEYSRHMFADFFSTKSLPFPGYSFLYESDSRQLRKLAVEMYKSGFNMKNIAVHTVLTTAIIEFVIRLWIAIENMKEYKDSIEIDEDYSNIDLLKSAFDKKHSEKMSEMLLVAHSIVTAVNLGKVSIECLSGNLYSGLADINITEIMSVVKYGIKVTKSVAERNSDYSKSMYYAKIAQDGWNALDALAEEDEIDIIKNMPELVIA